MENQIESNEYTPKEERQMEYVRKLQECMDLEIRINLATAEDWRSQLYYEARRPGLCEAAEEAIMRQLRELEDNATESDIDAYYDAIEAYCEALENDGQVPAPEEHPDYPLLEQLWAELSLLKGQL